MWCERMRATAGGTSRSLEVGLFLDLGFGLEVEGVVEGSWLAQWLL